MPLVPIKVAKGTIGQHIPAQFGSVRFGSVRLTCDYKAISVQLQLQLLTGTELGNKNGTENFEIAITCSLVFLGVVGVFWGCIGGCFGVFLGVLGVFRCFKVFLEVFGCL